MHIFVFFVDITGVPLGSEHFFDIDIAAFVSLYFTNYTSLCYTWKRVLKVISREVPYALKQHLVKKRQCHKSSFKNAVIHR